MELSRIWEIKRLKSKKKKVGFNPTKKVIVIRLI